MDRSNRKELSEAIDRQKEELDRYKSRLRDLAVAYRSLVKEKEALEASVKALSCQDTASSRGEQQEEDGQAKNQSEDDSGDTVHGSEASQLRQQIATLTLSLATLSEQKSKMETTYQDDKKRMRQEHMGAIEELNEEKENLKKIGDELTEQLAEMKSRLRVQQQERETDNLNHAAMMRELQTLVGKERTEKERMENKIFDLEDSLMRLRSTPDRSVEYESHIQRLSGELGAVRNQLLAAEEAARRPSPLLVQLQNDMAEMKAQHRIQIESEQQKRQETEERLERIRRVEEQRVADLESKLSALSDTVGSYDRERQHDLANIQRLKERITQLDLENTALARAANKSSVMNEEEVEDRDLSVSEIKERMTKLKGLLKLASQKAEKPVDIDDVCTIEDDSSRDTAPNHSACQQELKRLKEEFEAYKTRAANVLKNRTVKDSSHNKELEHLQGQLSEMRERVSALRQQLDDEENRHKQTVEDYQHRVAQMKDKHRAALSQAENEYKLKAVDLDQQVQKQRDRTMALLADKDLVIEDLKAQLASTRAETTTTNVTASHSEGAPGVDESRSVASEDCVSSEAEETVSQLTMSPAAQGVGGSSFLHFAEELSRREVELTMVKKQRQQAETALRQLQDKHATTMQNYEDQLDTLREQVDRWQRNRSREGTNMEYLKNVVLSYLQSDSYSTKKQMFNAIAAILQFTTKEKDGVQKKLNATWWGTGS